MKAQTIRLSDELYSRLAGLSDRLGLSFTQVVRIKLEEQTGVAELSGNLSAAVKASEQKIVAELTAEIRKISAQPQAETQPGIVIPEHLKMALDSIVEMTLIASAAGEEKDRQTKIRQRLKNDPADPEALGDLVQWFSRFFPNSLSDLNLVKIRAEAVRKGGR